MKPISITVCGLALTLLASPSLAEEPQGAAEPQEATAEPQEEAERPKMNLSVAEPGAPAERHAYVHNGFYFRASVGGGFLTSNLRVGSSYTETGTGFALGTDLMVGGSPSPGIALGLGALGNIGLATGIANNTALTQILIGPFLDAFPNDRDGWHLGILAGASPVFFGQDTFFGGGAGAMGGYDLWVAPEWSAGFNLRLTGTHSVMDGNSLTNFSGVLLISILNH